VILKDEIIVQIEELNNCDEVPAKENGGKSWNIQAS